MNHVKFIKENIDIFAGAIIFFQLLCDPCSVVYYLFLIR